MVYWNPTFLVVYDVCVVRLMHTYLLSAGSFPPSSLSNYNVYMYNVLSFDPLAPLRARLAPLSPFP